MKSSFEKITRENLKEPAFDLHKPEKARLKKKIGII